jgi:pyruvate/2-oxoglutarate dehydrogenase complex dihydrolipoamide acyltransferase (E2) component
VSGGAGQGMTPIATPVGAVRATPAARRLAKELGVDLAEAARTLALARALNEQDVRAYAAQRGPGGVRGTGTGAGGGGPARP